MSSCLSGFQRMLQLALKAVFLTIAIPCKREWIGYNLKGQHYKIIHYLMISQTYNGYRNVSERRYMEKWQWYRWNVEKETNILIKAASQPGGGGGYVRSGGCRRCVEQLCSYEPASVPALSRATVYSLLAQISVNATLTRFMLFLSVFLYRFTCSMVIFTCFLSSVL